jgi:hypothetical protein
MTSNTKRSKKAKVNYPTCGNGYYSDNADVAFGRKEKKNYGKEGEKKNG